MVPSYAYLVRPRLLLGRYRTEDPDPAALERRIEQVLGHATGWAWGGGAAAFRLTQHYRGAKTVLHVVHPATDLPRQLRGIPAADGPLVLLRIPGPIALESVVPHTAHPLLVYMMMPFTAAQITVLRQLQHSWGLERFVVVEVPISQIPAASSEPCVIPPPVMRSRSEDSRGAD